MPKFIDFKARFGIRDRCKLLGEPWSLGLSIALHERSKRVDGTVRTQSGRSIDVNQKAPYLKGYISLNHYRPGSLVQISR